MKSKRSCFNGALFFSSMRSLWPLWIVYVILLGLILPARLGGASGDWLRTLADGRIVTERWDVLTIFMAVMAAAAAMGVFRPLYDKRQTSFVCALPIRREAVYVSLLLAGLVPMLAGDFAVIALCAVLEAAQGVLNMPILLFLLAMMVLLNLTFYGFAALCAMLTGNVIVLPLVYLVLEVAAEAVSIMARGILSALVFGYSGSGSSLGNLSPLVRLAWGVPGYGPNEGDGLSFTVFPNFMIAIGLYAALGVCFALLGLWLYKRRAMESAGEVVAVPALRPVFRWCMALGCGLVYAWIFCAIRGGESFCGTAATVAWSIVIAALGAGFGWFSAEMLMKKTNRVFGEKRLGAFIAAGILAAGLLCAGNGFFGYENRVPDPAEVSAVSIAWGGTGYATEDADTILLVEQAHRTLLDGMRDYAAAGGESGRHSSNTGTIIYTLADGRQLQRVYTVYDPADFPAMADDVEALEAALNTDAAYEARKLDLTAGKDMLLQAVICANTSNTSNKGWSVSLESEDALELYAAVEKDLDARSFGYVRLFPDDSEYEGSYTVVFDLYELEEDPVAGHYLRTVDYAVFTVKENARYTFSWLRENLAVE